MALSTALVWVLGTTTRVPVGCHAWTTPDAPATGVHAHVGHPIALGGVVVHRTPQECLATPPELVGHWGRSL
ncbi:MAG: hypothetical protein ACRDQ5_15815 [Sciscionella sp.]